MTLDGITIEAKRTPSGIGYWEYGQSHWPTLVYLHGIGERGDGSEAQLMKLLNQGPLRRNGDLWFYKDVFTKGIRILYPQLPTSKGSWDVGYIDSFLDAVHTDQPLFITGWSLGGGGALRYVAQVIKKHKLTCFAGVASAISPTTGQNVDCPYWFAHATNDMTVNVSNTDNYVANIPNFDASRYSRGTSGDHWYMVKEAWGKPDLYDWFLSLCEPVIDIQGTIWKRGTKVIAKFGNDEIEL